MQRRGQTTTLQERLQISERAATGETDATIGGALGRAAEDAGQPRHLSGSWPLLAPAPLGLDHRLAGGHGS